MSINRTIIYREYVLPTIKTAASFAMCIAALHSVKLVSVFHDWYTQAGCQSSMQSPICASYTTAEALAGTVAIVGVLGLMKISAAHCPQVRIRTQVSLLAARHNLSPTVFFSPSKTVALPVMPKAICKARTGDRLGIAIRCNGTEAHNQSKTTAPRPEEEGCPCTNLPASAPLKTSISVRVRIETRFLKYPLV